MPAELVAVRTKLVEADPPADGVMGLLPKFADNPDVVPATERTMPAENPAIDVTLTVAEADPPC